MHEASASRCDRRIERTVTLSAEGCRKALAALRRHASGAAGDRAAKRVLGEAIFGRLRYRRICKLMPPQLQYLHTSDVRQIHNCGKGKARLLRYEMSTKHRVIEPVTIWPPVTIRVSARNQCLGYRFGSEKIRLWRAGVIFNRRWGYRSGGMRKQRPPHNDQSRITAATRFLLNN